MRFFVCKHCGNLAGLVENKGVPMVCCGEKMSELIPNTADAAFEKHVPVVKKAEQCACGCTCGSALTIEVGGTHHPMLEAHHIGFIYVETENGGKRRGLKIGEEPEVKVCCCDDKPVAVYAWCNLHGLWKTEIA
ncbi:MAG: desulfoferrodoxin [Firmicutes bacterium]|nr:desulfoferrodoxin [Bacillota bacterium]